jgi:hypothetical protein
MAGSVRRRFAVEARPDIQIGGIDQVAQSCGVEFGARLQFHVPHAFATSLQQAGGILEHCAVEETDVHMALEGVDVPEWRILYTCDRATIVHQLSDIVSALPHPRKPLLRNRPQLDRAFRQPDIDSRIPFYASGEPHDVDPTGQSAEVQRNARPMSGHDRLSHR